MSVCSSRGWTMLLLVAARRSSLPCRLGAAVSVARCKLPSPARVFIAAIASP
jgi:hypothetical protein